MQEVNTSIRKGEEQTIVEVFPNPASDKLFIRSLSDPIAAYALMTVGGRTLSQVINTTLQNTELTIANLASGVYFLQVKTVSGKTILKTVNKQ